MAVYSKLSYDDQDDGRILKAARKQQYIIFHAPIAFLNDELKAELGMKTNKEEEEDEMIFCIFKVPIDASGKDYKTYSVQIRKYGMGSLEGFLNWRMTLNKQIRNKWFAGNYQMVMILAQAMLVRCSLGDFVKDRRAQDVKNLTRLARRQQS
jgi:hypothetical protein